MPALPLRRAVLVAVALVGGVLAAPAAAASSLTIHGHRMLQMVVRLERAMTLDLAHVAYRGEPMTEESDVGGFVLLPLTSKAPATGLIQWPGGRQQIGTGWLAAGRYRLIVTPGGGGPARWTIPWSGRRTTWRPSTLAHAAFSRLIRTASPGSATHGWAAVWVRQSGGFVFTRMSYSAVGIGEDTTVCLSRNTPDAACPGLASQRKSVERTPPTVTGTGTVTAWFDRVSRESGRALWDMTAKGAVSDLTGFAFSMSP